MFTYDFRPVGQGLFCRGELEFFDRNQSKRRFHWVYDCGSENITPLHGEIDLFRRQLPDPKRLDLVILSHFDRDHIRGVGRLLNGLPVDYLVLPYLTPGQRMVIAAGTDPGDADFVRFLVDPLAYLTSMPGAQIGTIVFVLPSQGQMPPPPGEGEPHVPPDMPPTDFPTRPGFPKSRDDEDYELVIPPTGTNIRIEITDGQVPMVVLGLWEFAFYNRPAPQLRGDLLGLVKPIYAEFHGQPETDRNYGQFVEQLRAVYRQVFGVDAAGRNEISLVTYSGPLTAGLRKASYHCREQSTYLALSDCRGRPHGVAEKSDNGEVAVLYTGDLNVSKVTSLDFQRYFGSARWGRIRFIQVPHHGSRYSWECGQASEWKHDWSVFSAGINNRHGHPHVEVTGDLAGHGPTRVNEQQGAAWGGHAAWAAK